MNSISLIVLVQVLLLHLLAGAGFGAVIGAPQSRTEFVKKVKPGGIGRKAEHMTVKRPYQAVLKDMKGFADKCLNVRVSRSGNYGTREVGGSTNYHPKVVTIGKQASSLSVQEEYASKHANKGAPPGGVYVLVTEISAAGDGKTQVDIYHLYKGELVKPMKEWLTSEKRPCPKF